MYVIQGDFYKTHFHVILWIFDETIYLLLSLVFFLSDKLFSHEGCKPVLFELSQDIIEFVSLLSTFSL